MTGKQSDEQSNGDGATAPPEAFRRAGTDRPAFEPTESAGEGFRVTSTVFDARVTATTTGRRAIAFAVTVEMPTLEHAVDGEVGSAVAEGWLETLERRLADAPSATRTDVVLERFEVEHEGETVIVVYGFEFSEPETGLDVAKAFVEYAEGTYVEGVVPGYDYQPPVADLLADASQGDATRGGTPL